MKLGKLLPVILLLVLSFVSANSQERHRVMFYNVENLFDPFNDTLTNDDEFTPEGTRYWSWKRMTDKLNKISKVVTAVGEWDPPVVVGFCEVENGLVMNQLISETPLTKFGYKLVHRESPDRRGIDVALIYRPDRFELEEEHFFQVVNPDEPSRTTREVLYARGIVAGIDTVHFFVNHWPSKYGGALASEPGRLAAGKLVRQKVDSIRIFEPEARIVIMGDFNDIPSSAAITEALGAVPVSENFEIGKLYNLHHKYDVSSTGSLKYQGQWETIDMMIVSGGLLSRNHNLYVNPDGGMIYSNEFLLEQDEGFVGVRPFRTYIGFKYHGGFSDHLPIYIDLLPTK